MSQGAVSGCSQKPMLIEEIRQFECIEARVGQWLEPSCTLMVILDQSSSSMSVRKLWTNQKP